MIATKSQGRLLEAGVVASVVLCGDSGGDDVCCVATTQPGSRELLLLGRTADVELYVPTPNHPPARRRDKKGAAGKEKKL